MAYSKRRAAEQIFFAITGGKADRTQDVLMADIYSYLPAAINASIGEEIKERKILAIRERKPNNYRINDVLLIQSYTPQYDSKRNAYKIDLPFIIPSYNGSFPINLMTEQGTESIIFFDSRSKLQGIEEVMDATQYAWLERGLTGQTLYFKNLLCTDCTITVEAAADYDALGLDVELPVPSDLWERIFLRSEQHFRQQRGTNSDDSVDNNDNDLGENNKK